MSAGRPRRQQVLLAAAALLAACSSNRDAGPVGPQQPTPSSAAATAASSSTSVAPTGSAAEESAATAPTSSSSTSAGPTTSGAPTEVKGVAVAGNLGAAEASGPPFTKTDPFSEVVRLADGTCEGWADSRGGSTAGLTVGAPVVLLDVEQHRQIGEGEIVASRWADVSAGGQQWNCSFDFTATVTGTPGEFRVKVGGMEPWLARPDPADPTTFVASVSTDASISLIPQCPAVPSPPPSTPGSTSTTTPPTSTAPAQPVSGWNAIGQYWSRGVAALCSAGLPVTAIARPCRPPKVGSEYIAEVVDSSDPTVTYANGAAVPRGTALTVVVATGRPCG